ncbi:hypothetical protein EDC01DRAFT_222278 [Geopyxis carbonaria]|nr:hypothetical protein EDC01DRAFT_222278 [Geopyxis carbonaria]
MDSRNQQEDPPYVPVDEQSFAEQQPGIAPEVIVSTKPEEKIALTKPEEKIACEVPDTGSRKYNRKWFTVGGVILFVIVVMGAVLGGVLGSRAKKSAQGARDVSTKHKEPSGIISIISARPSSTIRATMTGTATSMYEWAYAYPTPINLPDIAIIAISPRSGHISAKSASINDSTNFGPSTFADRNWTDLDGATSSPRLHSAPHIDVLSTPHLCQIFLISIDNTFFMREYNSSDRKMSDDWISFKGSFYGAPTVVPSERWHSENWTVYATSGRGISQFSQANLKWSVISEGDQFFGSPSPRAASWGIGHVAVVAVDKSRRLQVITYDSKNGSTWAIKNLAGDATSRPAVVSRRTQYLDVLVRGGDGGLWHIANKAGVWTPWRSVSGATKIVAEPEVIMFSPDRLDAFAWGVEDNALLHWIYNGRTDEWREEERVGIDIEGPPKAVLHYNDVLSVAAFDRNMAVLWRTWKEEEGWWPKSGFHNLGVP